MHSCVAAAGFLSHGAELVQICDNMEAQCHVSLAVKVLPDSDVCLECLKLRMSCAHDLSVLALYDPNSGVSTACLKDCCLRTMQLK